ncbi:ribosomal protein S18-alanine N-acetyltransferase [Acidobacteriota bacterium]
MDEKDLPDVIAIENLSFPNPWRRSTFIGEIANRGMSFPFMIVHQLTGKNLGYIIYWKFNEEVQISNFAVHPDYRGYGLGKAVLRRLLDELIKEGVLYVFLEVRPSNYSARLLYEKMGFSVFGVRKDYYHDPPEDALVMGKSL